MGILSVLKCIHVCCHGHQSICGI